LDTHTNELNRDPSATSCLACKHHRFDVVDKGVHCAVQGGRVVNWVRAARTCPSFAAGPEAPAAKAVPAALAVPAATGTPAARKDDTGKVRMELLMDMPRALRGVAEVLTWAITKKKPVPYEAGSWQHVEGYYQRYSGALLRHHNNIAMNGQFALDAETGLLDLFHLATDALILAELAARQMEQQVPIYPSEKGPGR
jgi:hypothetical protein